jgi:hypothetical protein
MSYIWHMVNTKPRQPARDIRANQPREWDLRLHSGARYEAHVTNGEQGLVNHQRVIGRLTERG